MSLKQKEAVFNTVLTVLAKSGRVYGETTPVTLSKEEKELVVEIVTAGISAGEVAIKAAAADKYGTKETLSTYVSGMVGNWLAKDVRLNGGVKHQPKSPGSRAGQGDPFIKNLRSLLKTTASVADQAKINEAIATRQTELNAAKTGAASKVDVSKIPADLRKSLNI